MSKRIDDIELLRAFAVLFVVLQHAHGNLITWPSAGLDLLFNYVDGGVGVDLFFAISGFVIARDLLPKLGNCSNLKFFLNTSFAFWTRRVWRILPSAWLWLAIILLATLVFNRSGAFGSFDANMAGTIAAVLQFYNYHFANCFMRYDCGANFVYWSLSLEEQFYLVLPFAIYFCRSRLSLVLACLVVVQLIMHRSLLMLMFRSDGLLLGVLIAWWSDKPGYRRIEPRYLGYSRLVRLTLTLGLTTSLAVVAKDHQQWLGSYRFSMLALISSVLVLIASFNKNYLLAPSRFKRALTWVGLRSYAIYLIHVPGFFMTREIWYRIAAQGTVFDASYAIPYILTAVTIIVVMAEINYRMIETPLRRKGAEIASRIKLSGFVSSRPDQVPAEPL